MVNMLVSVLAIGVSTAALVVTAARSMHLTHMAICAAMAVMFAVLAAREDSTAVARNAGASEIASINARHMGMVWAWGALILVITYASVLVWKEWWQFFSAFAIAAGLCLFFSVVLRKDAEGRGDDETMLKLARYLAIAQLVGMAATAIGLIIDGKMTRYLNPRYTDWAGNNVFFFGALALGVISVLALRSNAKSAS